MTRQLEEEDRRALPSSRFRWQRIVLGAALLAVFLATTLVLWRTGVLDVLLDGETLEQAVGRLGPFGPTLVMGLMALAIVMSPIPSAPIALAAGAAYGHVWGTLYVAIGAETGALIAFAIARLIGYDALKAWLGGTCQPDSDRSLKISVDFVSVLPAADSVGKFTTL